jgi:hypothetical protein
MNSCSAARWSGSNAGARCSTPSCRTARP